MTSFKAKFADIAQEISESYGIECEIYDIPFPHSIYCGVVKFNDPDKLGKLWEKVNTSLSISISDNFENDFQKWNFYIIYLCNFDIPKKVKYQIENNKFYSRKITLSKKQIGSRTISEIFSEDVIFTDIGLKVGSINKSMKHTAKYNSDLLDMVPQTSLSKDGLMDLYEAIGSKMEKSNEA
ncbi:ABC-three component system middle component 1 [Vibrio rarus]|uniref:ABC-three component system middle component 1 n=1 Tax=Vibrio rarus TaxID=413403 RepID=UPI0021C27F43|nr:ABC-three component system middle component 1 [Vibrio rarus]